jgi:hypothetical protein
MPHTGGAVPSPIDHVFIFSDAACREAEDIAALGLIEWPARTHPGQGTSNRTFGLHDGYLELICIQNELEARSPLTAPTRLWERSRDTGWSPIGVCLRTDTRTDVVFADAIRYQPQYFPDGWIDIAKTHPWEPMLFRIHVASRVEKVVPPHPCGVRTLRGITIGIVNDHESTAFAAARALGAFATRASPHPALTLTVDAAIHYKGMNGRLTIRGDGS